MSSNDRDSSITTRRKPFVLIVEDDEDTCEVFQLALNQQGFDTKAVRRTDQALDVLTERIPDVILLDYSIPGKLGATDLAAVALSQNLPSKLVLVTGVSNPLQAARLLNIKHVLQKPCALDELLNLVERLTSAGSLG